MERLIEAKDIPGVLWDATNSSLVLPAVLINEWSRVLLEQGILEKAKGISPERIGGGISKQDTDDHFAWKYTGSCARIMLSMLDPKYDLEIVSNAYAKVFAGNRVFIADLPCGAGAATAVILTVLAELRKQNRVPRMPLDVVVVGGEISPYARDYAESIWNGIRQDLAEQGIFLTFKLMEWDVTSNVSTSDLVKEIILSSAGSGTQVLLVTNFSNFLESGTNRKKAESQVEELFRYNRGPQSVSLWIEPSTIIKNMNLLSWLGGTIKNAFCKLIGWKDVDVEEQCVEAQSMARHPLKDHFFHVSLVVLRQDLPG